MRVAMKYGSGSLELSLEERLFAGHHHLGAVEAPRSGLLAHAFTELDQRGFFSTVQGRRVAVLLPDGTREALPEGLLEGLRGRLRGASGVVLFVCTGTHDPAMDLNRALVASLAERVSGWEPAPQLHVHDARGEEHRLVGRTSRGHPVELSPAYLECECSLALSSMKYHYFAGYSNPVKCLLPGLASEEFARANHALALEEEATFGAHPWHPDPARRGNPLARDMVEGFELLGGAGRHFALCWVGDPARLLWAGAGELVDTAGRGMRAVDRFSGLTVEPTRYLVVSPGGAPHDESLYTAQRALELTRGAVRDGGEVLFLAECPNGVGSAAARRNFFDPLAKPLAQASEVPPGPYVLYSHKSVKFARYIRGLGAVRVLSRLGSGELGRIHLTPERDPARVLQAWAAGAGPGDRVTFIDDASKLAVVGTG